MESVIKQLVKIGHGMSAEVANDEPAVAKLLVELSSALDVQYERANALESKCAALAAELKQSQIDAGCYKKGMEASNERLVQVAAENAGLMELIEQHAGSIAVCPNCSHEEPSETDDIVALYRSRETPATDASLAELRAQESKRIYESILDNPAVTDMGSLVDCLEQYANDSVAFAAQLRKGVQS